MKFSLNTLLYVPKTKDDILATTGNIVGVYLSVWAISIKNVLF
jgi:hypothetical protein